MSLPEFMRVMIGEIKFVVPESFETFVRDPI